MRNQNILFLLTLILTTNSFAIQNNRKKQLCTSIELTQNQNLPIKNNDCFVLLNNHSNKAVSYINPEKKNISLTSKIVSLNEIICAEIGSKNSYFLIFENSRQKKVFTVDMKEDNIIKELKTGKINQQFKILYKGENEFYIISLLNGKILGTNKNGDLSLMKKQDYDSHQIWSFISSKKIIFKQKYDHNDLINNVILANKKNKRKIMRSKHVMKDNIYKRKFYNSKNHRKIKNTRQIIFKRRNQNKLKILKRFHHKKFSKKTAYSHELKHNKNETQNDKKNLDKSQLQSKKENKLLKNETVILPNPIAEKNNVKNREINMTKKIKNCPKKVYDIPLLKPSQNSIKILEKNDEEYEISSEPENNNEDKVLNKSKHILRKKKAQKEKKTILKPKKLKEKLQISSEEVINQDKNNEFQTPEKEDQIDSKEINHYTKNNTKIILKPKILKEKPQISSEEELNQDKHNEFQKAEKEDQIDSKEINYNTKNNTTQEETKTILKPEKLKEKLQISSEELPDQDKNKEFQTAEKDNQIDSKVINYNTKNNTTQEERRKDNSELAPKKKIYTKNDYNLKILDEEKVEDENIDAPKNPVTSVESKLEPIPQVNNHDKNIKENIPQNKMKINKKLKSQKNMLPIQDSNVETEANKNENTEKTNKFESNSPNLKDKQHSRSEKKKFIPLQDAKEETLENNKSGNFNVNENFNIPQTIIKNELFEGNNYEPLNLENIDDDDSNDDLTIYLGSRKLLDDF